MQMITLHHADDNNKKNEQVFMRIITGEFKGRHFDVPRSFKARPTTPSVLSNSFSVVGALILGEFAISAKALDLFAGTGSISLELLSRGCQAVTSIEADRDHAAFIRQCVTKLGVTNHNLIRGDVLRFFKSCRRHLDVVFAAPPDALPQLDTIPSLILENNLLKPDGVLVFEHGKQNDFSTLPQFVEHRAYGSVNFSIFRPTPTQP